MYLIRIVFLLIVVAGTSVGRVPFVHADVFTGTSPETSQTYTEYTYGGCAGAGYKATVTRTKDSAGNYIYSFDGAWRGDYSGWFPVHQDGITRSATFGGSYGRDTVRMVLDIDQTGNRSVAHLTVSSCKGIMTLPAISQDWTYHQGDERAYLYIMLGSPNLTPQTPTVTCQPIVRVGDSLPCTFTGGSDPSGDTIRYAVDWNNDGTAEEYAPTNGYMVSGGSAMTTTNWWTAAGTYTFKVRTEDSHGNVSGWVTSGPITVIDPYPSVTLTASKTSFQAGDQPVTLQWVSQRATSCTGTNFDTGGATQGSVTVSPTATTTYSISCSATDRAITTTTTTKTQEVLSPSPDTSPPYSEYTYGGCAGAGYNVTISRSRDQNNDFSYTMTSSRRGDYSGWIANQTLQNITSTTGWIGGRYGRDTVLVQLAIDPASPHRSGATIYVSSCKGDTKLPAISQDWWYHQGNEHAYAAITPFPLDTTEQIPVQTTIVGPPYPVTVNDSKTITYGTISCASSVNGVCTCSANQVAQGNGCICPDTSIWNGTQCTCPASGQSLVNNVCTCPGNEIVNGGMCTCPISGEILVNNACACPTGESIEGDSCGCPSGKVYDKANGVCKDPCIPTLVCDYANNNIMDTNGCQAPIPCGSLACYGAQCADTHISISATPKFAGVGKTVLISWSAVNVASCTVTGTNDDGPWACTSSDCLSGSHATIAISQSTIYTLLCYDRAGHATSTSAAISVVPAYSEY